MKLSADFQTGNLRLLFGKESDPLNSQLAGLPLNRNVKGIVLEIFPGGAWISIGGKKLKTTSDSGPLFVGEILTLAVKSGKKGIELRILERELKGNENSPYKLETMGMSVRELSEKMNGADFKDASPETSLFKVLKTYYPFLEWNSELPHFRWEFPGGNAEGTYDPQEETKKFLFRIQTEKTGKTMVLFLWKENSGEDLQINATFDNFKMYLHACQNKEKFKRILMESSVSFQGYNLAYKSSLTQKEWNA
ncbi:hypothetical protein [Leptospira barantonii]|uniref:Uncharacterized protein n=1 Tax=Leptospira barantonii TaxID=2023184 RepID=A0ABX4NIE6_9LEPT|nr:hypothetical protein [Leptospira barantonii]PJZ56099.1 hypothetical protein CH367_17535 [Leptospira barantonii]